MRTAPAFQLYTADFIGGTMLMEAHEVGAYIRLLCYQWAQGAIPNNPAKIEKITGVKAAKLADVLSKFTESENGETIANQRMESVRNELNDYRELSKKGGAASGAKRTGNSEWGKQMAAKRQRTGSLPSNEQMSEPVANRATNIQSQSQSHIPPKPPEPPAPPSLELIGESAPRPVLTPEQLEVGSWFGRKPTTAWSEKELKAWAKITAIDPEDWRALRWYYSQSGCQRLRRDLVTLLNNWQGEIDRAKNFDPNDK